MKNKNIRFVVLVLLLVVILCASIIIMQNHGKKGASAELENSYSKIATKGDKSAPVHIVEFGDYKCPFCKEFNKSVVPYINNQYIETKKVQFHFINYPFLGSDSHYIAEFAETVRQELGEDSFWKFHDLVYANQGDESKIWGTEDNLTKVLKVFASDKDVDKVVKAVRKEKYKKTIDEQNQLVKNLQIKGTPSIYINGKSVTLSTQKDLTNQIEKAISESK